MNPSARLCAFPLLCWPKKSEGLLPLLRFGNRLMTCSTTFFPAAVEKKKTITVGSRYAEKHSTSSMSSKEMTTAVLIARRGAAKFRKASLSAKKTYENMQYWLSRQKRNLNKLLEGDPSLTISTDVGREEVAKSFYSAARGGKQATLDNLDHVLRKTTLLAEGSDRRKFFIALIPHVRAKLNKQRTVAAQNARDKVVKGGDSEYELVEPVDSACGLY